MLEIVNLVLREGGDIIQFLGICEAIFRVRDIFFCVEPHIRIYFTDIKSFFNLDNLEPAPGRLAPELEIKAIKFHEISPSLITKLTISSTKSTRLFQTYIYVFHNMFFDIHKC